MKCPNCGAEMKEDRLYCENCGEDIHIVPDFEPELERNIEQSLGRIVEEVTQTDKSDKKKVSKGKVRFLVGWGVIGVVALCLVVGVVMLFQQFSPKYQTKKARQATTKGKYEQAIRYYTRAMELDEFNVDLKFELAEVYFLKNDKTEYEYWLLDIVDDPGTDSEQLESAYGKLIAIYKARGEYQTINDMLLECRNETIKASYHGYLAQSPQFSISSGEYTEVQALKLTVTGKGTIYYTTDGSVPDENSTNYTAPILLENGIYRIYAIFVNENGVYSEPVHADYYIDVEELDAPEINADGGEYSSPINITVMNDTENIYYTTDGSAPTMDSLRYTNPIPMPLGVSTFKFARLEPGRTSQIVERTYTFVLDTDLTAEAAVDKVREYSLSTGKIMDNSGHFDETKACYQYQFLWVTNINDINDFYVIAEVLVDAEGISTKTGNYYAVNAYTGNLYKLQISEGVYTLVEI